MRSGPRAGDRRDRRTRSAREDRLLPRHHVVRLPGAEVNMNRRHFLQRAGALSMLSVMPARDSRNPRATTRRSCACSCTAATTATTPSSRWTLRDTRSTPRCAPPPRACRSARRRSCRSSRRASARHSASTRLRRARDALQPAQARGHVQRRHARPADLEVAIHRGAGPVVALLAFRPAGAVAKLGVAGPSATGWGGRIADKVAAQNAAHRTFRW